MSSLSILVKVISIFILCFKNAFSQCPPESYVGLDSRCYKFFDLPLSYTRALDICTRHNGILVSIPNELVNTYLRGETSRRFTPYAFTSFWIGANDLAVLNQWIWQDGLGMAFLKWQESHPLHDDLVHNCGSMWIENGLWFSADCAEEKPFVCTVGFLPTTPGHIDPKPIVEEVKPTEPLPPPPANPEIPAPAAEQPPPPQPENHPEQPPPEVPPPV